MKQGTQNWCSGTTQRYRLGWEVGGRFRIRGDTCIPVFIVSLFTIGRTQKQPGCPSEDEWIMKFWYIYTQ